jgi:hypothetical protein
MNPPGRRKRIAGRVLDGTGLLSLLLCVATVGLWVRSYEPKTSGVTLLAGQSDVEHWRGQLWVIRHAPNRDPSFVRTTVHLRLTGPHPDALIKAMVIDRGAPWDVKHRLPTQLLARPYVMVNFPDGIGLDNACGFAAATGGLPATVPGLERYGSVLRAVAAPHWFVVALTAVAPTVWLRKQMALRRAARRFRTGLCRLCGYDLRATPNGRCPECGAVTGFGGETGFVAPLRGDPTPPKTSPSP